MKKAQLTTYRRAGRRRARGLLLWAAVAAPLFLAACGDDADQVGEFNNDRVDNEIKADPLATDKAAQVTAG